MALLQRWIPMAALAVLLPACTATLDTGLDLGAAGGLADAGTVASIAMSEEAAASRDAFLDDGRRSDLLFYLGRAAAPPSAVPAAEIARSSPARAANEKRR